MSNNNKTSKVWNYFTISEGMSLKHAKACCKLCNLSISNIDGSTTAMSRHLNIIHGIDLKKMSAAEEVDAMRNNKKSKTMMDFVNRKSLEEIVSKLAAVDGISIRAITRSEFIRESIAKCTKGLPKNETDVMNLVHKYYMVKKTEIIHELEQKKQQNKRFSITLDEWTSMRMKKYVNINVHCAEEKDSYNLGLVRIFGTCSAIQLLTLVTSHLASFKIDLESDIIGSTSDGAKVMIKFGRECPVIFQLCLSHGIHLGICDTLYRSKTCDEIDDIIVSYQNNHELDSDDDNFEDNDLEILTYNDETDCQEQIFYNNIDVNDNIKIVRKIVKFFRYSTIRNSVLQEKITKKIGHEFQLILDVKTRWNSMANMVEIFLKLKEFVEEALADLNATNLLNNINFKLLTELSEALKPIRLTIETLGRKDATLFSADLTINFMKNKLKESNTQISSALLNNISKRVDERINLNLMNLLKCLKDTNNVPSKQAINLAENIMRRIFKDNESLVVNGSDSNVQVNEPEHQKEFTMEEELSEILKSGNEEPMEKTDFDKLKQEFVLYKNTGKRTENLQKLFNALCSIKPTSTDCERAFSVSNNFCTKIRSKLSDKSLNSLIFLKFYFLRQN